MINLKHIKLLLLLGLAPLAASADNTVGTPDADVEISQNGAATYNLSIEIPDGGGFQPKIGLAYNSQATGYGNAGYGFNITGISVITSGAKDMYRDGEVAGSNGDDKSSFYLDGKRMLLIEGTSGQIGAKYQIEGDPNTLVTLKGTYGMSYQQNCDIWFEVRTPDGAIYNYGDDSSSRLIYTTAQGRTGFSAWYVTQAVDKYNNCIKYSYSQENLCILPQKIVYGIKSPNDNSKNIRQLSCWIHFIYTSISQNNQKTFYLGRSQGKIAKKLSAIKTMINNNPNSQSSGSLYRQYTLTYSDNLDGGYKKYTRLTSIVESNGNGEKYNPITINWNGLPSFNISTSNISACTKTPSRTEKNKSFAAVDLNNDGVSDIVRYTNYDKSKNEWHCSLNIALSEKNASNVVSYKQVSEFNIGTYQFDDDGFKTGVKGFYAGDFNGDGYTDLIIPTYNHYSNTWYQYFSIVRGGEKVNNYSSSYTNSPSKNWDYKPITTTMDINGDGKMDLLSFSSVKYQGYHYLDILSNDKWETAKLFMTMEPSDVYVGDYNNDGLSDLLFTAEDGYMVYFNNGYKGDVKEVFTKANSKYYISTESSTKPCLRKHWKVNQGDFNGDGLIDFMYIKRKDTHLWIAYNNGDGSFTYSQAYDLGTSDHAASQDDNKFSLNVFDMDQDGLSDIVMCKAEYKYNGNWEAFWGNSYDYKHTRFLWLRSTGSSFECKMDYKKNRAEDAVEGYVFPGDFDGDGAIELANYGSILNNTTSTAFTENKINIYKGAGNTASMGRISKITDALGVETSMTYSISTDPAVCTNSSKGTYPVLTYKTPISVVSKITTSGKGVYSNTTQFTYGDYKVHVGGRGALGFASFTKKNTNTNITESTTVNTWDSNYRVPTKVTNTTSLPNGTKSTTVAYTTVAELGNALSGKISKYFAYPSKSTVTDYDSNVTTTTWTYDTAKGVMTNQKVSDDGGAMYKQETYTYPSSKIANTWLPTQKKVIQKHSDDSKTYSVITKYTYDSYGNLLTKVTTPNSTSSLALTTTYTYDSFGNKKSEVTTGSNVKAIKKLYNYDPSYRYVTSEKTQPASKDIAKYIAYKYNLFGDMSAEIDSTVSTNVLVTSYVYNKWNELTKKTYPDKNYVTFTKAWDSSKNNGCYSITEAPNNGPKVKTIYDVLEREVFSTSKDLGNIDVSKETAYGTNGKVCRIATTTGQHTKVENFGYDNRIRMVAHVVQPVANTPNQYTTVYSYGNRKTSKTLDGRSVTTTYDAWGNAKTVTDNGGTINYTYFSNGLPKTVGSINIEYDAAGNKTSLTDPDAGTKKYTYAADGTILTETDARGVVTTYTYDSLGRLTRTKIGSNIIRNYYKNGGYGHLQLEEQSLNGFVTKYTYDKYGRVTTETRSTDKATLTNTYSYNSKGQLSQRTFTGGLTVKYYYDINGFDSLVVANNKVVHRVVANTGSSNSLSTTYSFLDKMNITTTKTFTSSNCNTNIRIKNGSSVIDNYDDSRQLTTGNMLSRQKNTDMPESFSYDNCDRLTKVSHPDGTGLEMSYGKDGIMTRKSDMGNYNYDNKEHAHAVSSVTECVSSKIYDYNRVSTEFNDFGKVSSIGDDHSNMRYYYGPDLQRWRSYYSNASRKEWEALYFGDYERITDNGKIREFYYVCDNVIIVRENLGAFKPCLVLTDGLGSILTVRDENATKVFDATYDVWGKQTVKVNSIGLMRGYTGHEHVYGYEFINMNGRIYDPILAQFLSPDNYVQDPTSSQNFNRYAYCVNNPLKYIDPDGNLAWFVPVIIGAAIGGIHAAANHDNVLGGIIIGGVVGALSAWTGGAAAGIVKAGNVWAGALIGAATGAATGAAATFVETTLNNYVNGRRWNENMSSVWSSAVSGAITGAIAGGFKAYNSCKKDNVNPWTGEEKRVTHANEVAGRMQPDQTKHCAYYSGEYASKQIRKDVTAEYLLKQNGYADGQDVVACWDNAKCGIKVSGRLTSLPKGTDLTSFAAGFDAKKVTAELTVNMAGTNHVTTLSKFDTVVKRNWFGGGKHLIMDNVKIFDPLSGKTRSFNNNTTPLQVFDWIR